MWTPPRALLSALVLSFAFGLFADRLGAQGLTVVSVTPSANSTAAPVSGAISVTFDRAIDPVSVTPASFWAFARWSGPVDGAVSLSAGGTVLTLTPSSPYSAGESVMVLLSSAITALDATTLSDGYSFTFWAATLPAPAQFEFLQQFSTRSSPGLLTRSYGGVASDLNHDGALDFAVINEISEDLRVFLNLNDGVGTLGPMVQPPSPLGAEASPNEPTDFDRDGEIDLVVANASSGTISVLLGNGDGTFQALPQIPVGSNPLGVTILDFDGDGDVDIVNTNTGSSNLSAIENLGGGNFGPPVFFDAGGNGERAIQAADMNGDGRLDLVVGAINSGTLHVLTSNGDGTFTTVETESGVSGTWMLALGDLNGDGHVDVTSANSFANTGSVSFGSGTGSLSPPVATAADPFTIATDLGDLDGDGDLDWVTSSFSGDWLIWLNNGAGGFSLGQEIFAPTAASCATLMDVDGDGDLDLALIDEIDDVVILQRNGPPGTPEEYIRGDANADGTVDIADAIGMLGSLFGGASPAACLDANDANDDGAADISDPITVLAYLFSAMLPPPLPFPTCGPDPTTDPLDCGAFSTCP